MKGGTEPHAQDPVHPRPARMRMAGKRDDEAGRKAPEMPFDLPLDTGRNTAHACIDATMRPTSASTALRADGSVEGKSRGWCPEANPCRQP